MVLVYFSNFSRHPLEARGESTSFNKALQLALQVISGILKVKYILDSIQPLYKMILFFFTGKRPLGTGKVSKYFGGVNLHPPKINRSRKNTPSNSFYIFF